eukprot:CAMPEP_0117661190 /NCGR_PEP_ID=MMETSP0804-20121206/7408_1 /TAXON_ID=1074897 /ORGANISM="Tetraselmis astigmatica, Strain CCMP880" /LENGTH=3186 /DNA_ID=CAMNT_0005468047 /DNA_START=424 /DNA_END=9983 /DNA_ORIENTATION=-
MASTLTGAAAAAAAVTPMAPPQEQECAWALLKHHTRLPAASQQHQPQSCGKAQNQLLPASASINAQSSTSGVPPSPKDGDYQSPPRGPNTKYTFLASSLSSPGSPSSALSPLLETPPADDVPVCVVVHVRPLIENELTWGCSRCLEVDSEREEVSVTTVDKHFSFDRVFGEDGTPREELYPLCVTPLVDGFFNGYNATVLAYGQTGSGKTYTMGTAASAISSVAEGTDTLEEAIRWLGVVPRFMKELYSRIRSSQTEDVEFSVRCSFMEIYQNHVRDLLNPHNTQSIEIRESNKSNVQVLGLTEKDAPGESEMMQLLQEGLSWRATSGTRMNLHSSRSHAIFTCTLEQKRRIYAQLEDALPSCSILPCSGTSDNGGVSTAVGEELLTAKMHLVDLAGSERIKKSGASGVQQKQAACINLGLLNLRNVIEALVTKSTFIPYRSNKLTRLLQDSLGGNSRTLFVACVSPADLNMDETLSTLQYAAEARKIKNKPTVNCDKDSKQLVALQEELRRTREQLHELRKSSGDSLDPSSGLGLSPGEIEAMKAECEYWRARAIASEALVYELKEANMHLVEAMQSSDLHPANSQAGGQALGTGSSNSRSPGALGSAVFSPAGVVSSGGHLDSRQLASLKGLFKEPSSASGSQLDKDGARLLKRDATEENAKATEGERMDGHPPNGLFSVPSLMRSASTFEDELSESPARRLPAVLFDLLGDEVLQRLQVEHESAELGAKIRLAEASASRLQSLQGSVMNSDSSLRLPPQRHHIPEWLQRAVALQTQEQELELMIEAEMGRRASLASGVRMARAHLESDQQGTDSASSTMEQQEHLASLEESLACRTADIMELQRLQMVARSGSNSDQCLSWVTNQDAKLVLSAAFRAAVHQRSRLLEMKGELTRLQSEMNWRDRLLYALEAALLTVSADTSSTLRRTSLRAARGTGSPAGLCQRSTQTEETQAGESDALAAESPTAPALATTAAVASQAQQLTSSISVLADLAAAWILPAEEAVAQAAVELLGHLSCSGQAMANCGTREVSGLVSLLCLPDPTVRQAAAACLGGIAAQSREGARLLLEAEGAVVGLIAMLSAKPPQRGKEPDTAQAEDQTGVAAAAAQALEVAATRDPEEAASCMGPAIGPLFTILKEQPVTDPVVAAAAGCLAVLMEDTGIAAEVSGQQKQSVAVLWRLLSSEGATVRSRWAAASALSRLVSSDQDLKVVRAARGLESLAATVLHSNDHQGEEAAADGRGGGGGGASGMGAVAQMCLALCHWPQGRAVLVEAKLLPALVRCLWVGGCSAATEAAARALRLLVTCEEPPTARPAVVRAGAMFALVHTCGEGSARAQEAAARALEALSSSSAIKEVLGRVGAIPTLVSQLQGRALHHHQQRRGVAADSSNPKQSRVQHPVHDGLPAEGSDLPSRAAAVCALIRLVTEDEAGASPISPMRTGAMAQQLVGLKVPLAGRRASATALWKAALVKDNRLAVVKSGGERSIVSLLSLSLKEAVASGGAAGASSPSAATSSSATTFSSNCAAVSAACAECLYQLVRTPQCLAAVVAAGAIPPLMHMLSMEPSPCGSGYHAVPLSAQAAAAAGQRAAMHAVRGLAEDTEARAVILAIGGLPAVAAVLQGSTAAEARTSAAATLAVLVDSRVAADSMLSSGHTLQYLLDMICDGGRLEQQAAMSAVRSVSLVDDGNLCPALVAADTIGCLAHLLDAAAATQTRQLPGIDAAEDHVEGLEVVAAGIMQVLTACLEGRAYATRTRGLQEVLTALLKQPAGGDLERPAVAVVFHCMSDPLLRVEVCQAVLRIRAVNRFISILRGSVHSGGGASRGGAGSSARGSSPRTGSVLSYEECVPLLDLLSTQSEAVSAMHLAGAAAPLVAVLGSPRATEAVQAAVARILRRLAKVPGAAPRLIAEGAVRHLLSVLCGPPERSLGARKVAALALVELVDRGEGWKERVWGEAAASHRVPAALSHLLEAPEVAVRYAAAEAMHLILRSQDQWIQVASAGGVNHLEVLLMDDVPVELRRAGREEDLSAAQSGRQAAARCLASMAGVEGAIGMREEDMLPRMMVFLHTCEPRLLESVLHVITGMLSANKTRTKLAKEDGMKRIIELLESEREETAVAAVLALERLAYNDSNKAAIGRLGGVPPLVRMLARAGSNRELLAAACALENLALDDWNKAAIACANGIEPLVAILSSGDKQSQIASAKVLTNLALDEANRSLISAAGAAPFLVELLRAGSKAGQEAAAGAVENLALSPAVCTELALIGAIPPLVMMMDHSSDTGKETAAGAIENMSLQPDLCSHIVEAGAIVPLLQMLMSQATRVPEAAASALQNLALGEHSRSAITRAGGVAALVNLLREGSSSAWEAAAGALGNLALDTDSRSMLVREGAVPALVRLLGSANLGAKEAAAGAVENMCLDDNYCHLVAEAGAVEPLVGMLQDRSDSLKEAAVAALRRLSSKLDEVKMSIASAGGVALLVQLLRNGSDNAQEAAAAMLEKLSTGPEPMLAIAQVGGLSALLNLLQKGNPEAIEAAARTIANSAKLQQNSDEIQKMGGLEILVDLLQNGDNAGREGAARALQNMCLSEHNRKMVADLDGVSAIMSLLLTGSESSREAALGTIENMALSNPNRVKLMNQGALEVLADTLQGGGDGKVSKGARLAATRALINFASNDLCKERIVQVGCVRPLVHQLSVQDEALQEAAARALQNLSLWDDNRAVIASAGAIPPLLAFLEKGNLDMKEVAARTLWSLAVLSDNREVIVRAGGVSLLLDLVLTGTEKGKEAAAGALQNLAIDEDISMSVERAGGLKLIVDLVSSKEEACRVTAMGALQNLVLNEHNRQSAAAVAAIPALVASLEEGRPLEKEAAAGVLRNLAMCDANCEKMARAGATAPLARLLQEGSSAAQEVAAGALENLLLTDGSDELVDPRVVAPPLVGMLVSGCREARNAAVGALEGIARETDHLRRMLRGLGVVPRLVALLAAREDGAEDYESASLAAGLLESLALEPGCAEEIVARGGLPCLLELLASTSAEDLDDEGYALEAREAAAGVLCNLALSPANCDAVVEIGALPTLLALVERGYDPATEAAANSIKNIALCKAGRDALQQLGAVDVMAEMLLVSPDLHVSVRATVEAVMAHLGHHAEQAAAGTAPHMSDGGGSQVAPMQHRGEQPAKGGQENGILNVLRLW